MELRFDDELVEGQLRDSVARHQPLLAFRQVFAFDPAFMQRLAALDENLDDDAIDRAARPYAWNGGRPLEVMREVIRRIVNMESSDLTFCVLNFVPVPGGVLETPSIAARWKKGGDYRAAAEKLARLGSDRCLAPRCATPARSRQRYCRAHSGRLSDYAQIHGRADRDAIRGLLLAVGDVIGVPG